MRHIYEKYRALDRIMCSNFQSGYSTELRKQVSRNLEKTKVVNCGFRGLKILLFFVSPSVRCGVFYGS